jgi:hypothetical protein
LEQTVIKIDLAKKKGGIMNIKENLHSYVHKSLGRLIDDQKCEGSNCLFNPLKDVYR